MTEHQRHHWRTPFLQKPVKIRHNVAISSRTVVRLEIPSMNNSPGASAAPFSGYQKAVIGMLAFLQFAVILDFMLMSPLGAVIMPALSITPAQFGLVVSAYAFAAGASGLLTAGFADRFDRKRL